MALRGMLKFFLEFDAVYPDLMDLLVLSILSNAISIRPHIMLIAVINFFDNLAIVCTLGNKELR